MIDASFRLTSNHCDPFLHSEMLTSGNMFGLYRPRPNGPGSSKAPMKLYLDRVM
ncbi:hypothetical protein HanXRQr2_Chr17g0786521 [Helianthus annuus]|uniref:Uncharacterized protein n=1 Tax=Helianthus annuus TaxID=4232 RepID=A0A9K3GST9_HELAN|nr:hypothetical protein HanXRQr2_Chr17g0786521 [Helianthus annuus]KAJ0811793.1 hypothetical protein HanPSC8_Chr17g0754721 [Helianthus annuus]